MKVERESVLKCIYECGDDDEKLVSELDRIVEESGDDTYRVIFHVLTHLDIPAGKGKACWEEILAHREIMIESLGRKVNLRTAICDYFCSINKSLKNPKVVELHIFEAKANSAKYDYLTGLYTRNYFDGMLERELARTKRHQTEASVLFFDIDDFKLINDCHGHLAGDLTLKKVAQIIMNEVRSEDVASRYGGEEIVVLLPETGKAKALVVGERIREKVEAMRIEYQKSSISLTISGGLASYPMDADNSENLLRFADEALYKAKGFGKNNVYMFSQNKRRYLRVDFKADIVFKKIGFNEATKSGAMSKNISLNGILFESENPLDIGTKIHLRIPFNNTEVPLTIIGTVVRVEIFDTGRYDIGVSFLEMDQTTKNEISQYLIRQLRKMESSSLSIH